MIEVVAEHPGLIPEVDCGQANVRKSSRVTRPDLRDFSELVARRAKNHDDTVIDCTDHERFGIVIAKLFELGRNRVGVFSDHLCRFSFTDDGTGTHADGPYWSNPAVIAAAQQFLKREDSLLEIAVGHKLDCEDGKALAGSEFLSGVVQAERNGTIVLYVSADGRAGSATLRDVNFVVSDENGFRLEKPHDKAPALLRFGRQNVNRSLFNAFDEMADLFDNAIASGRHNCLKLVYGCDTKDLLKPSGIAPVGDVADVVAPFLTDQVKCPPKPNEVVFPGPARFVRPASASPR